jgi:hypothetical protein
LLELPDELWLLLFGEIDTDIFRLADTIPTVHAMLNSYDFIRIRELQCFCLKENFLNTKLGIGVASAIQSMVLDLITGSRWRFHIATGEM